MGWENFLCDMFSFLFTQGKLSEGIFTKVLQKDKLNPGPRIKQELTEYIDRVMNI